MSDASPHVLAHLTQLREGAALGLVVDLACGRGRNALAIAAHGIPVLGVDRSAEFLAELCGAARERQIEVRAVRADLESAPAVPLRAGRLGALVVCRYLHRPLAAVLSTLLAPGGWLLYETFTIHQRKLGYGPERSAFLLEPDELRALFSALETLRAEETLVRAPATEAVARLVARKRA